MYDALHNQYQTAAPQWYALSTRSRHEKQVRDRLAAIGIEPLLPLGQTLSHWSDRKVWITNPLFPGYCFAKFSLASRLPILQTPGVVRIVGSMNPEPIPEEDVAAMQKLLASERRAESCQYLVEGEWVQVIRGPLAGIRGQFLRKGQQGCLVIRAHLIQQAAMVHVDVNEVVSVEHALSARSAA